MKTRPPSRFTATDNGTKAERRGRLAEGNKSWFFGAVMRITVRIAASLMRTRITIGRTRMRISALAILIYRRVICEFSEP